jgi:bifunctional lysine-specific demethylase and histidyl-hydroxylase MINA
VYDGMMFDDAQRTLKQFLSPLTLDEFLDRALVGGFRKIGPGDPARVNLLGSDPYAVLHTAVHLAPELTFHSANPSGPPPMLQSVADAIDFRQRIEQFHLRNYSVRFPGLRPLSPALDSLARAFEVLLHQPVTASAFWSHGGMRAPVHFDDHDLLVVQLRGTKRWYISNQPSELCNPWAAVPAATLDLGAHETLDLRPGDLLYVPRGTLHTVDSDTESLHLSIGFTPLTLRGALIAAIDHLSDIDRPLRTTVGGRLGFQLMGAGIERLNAPVLEGAARLLGACRRAGFITEALQRRSARAVASLEQLSLRESMAAIDLDTVLIQAETAFCHLTATADNIDFSYPGGHIYIHRGAQECVLYMVNTRRFAVRDIPGALDDEVRLSLAGKFLQIGFLEVEAVSMSADTMRHSRRELRLSNSLEPPKSNR